MKVERDVARTCADTESVARAYLKGRGFSQYRTATGLMSGNVLLDSHGTRLGTHSIRRDLTRDKVPFWVWSSALHAIVSLSAKPLPTGCRLGLYIDFGSLHTGVIGIIPAGEPLALRSNGKLEAEYLDAIEAQMKNGNR